MENSTLVFDTFECSDESLKSRDNVNISAHYCNAVHDGIACWPPTPPGVKIAQHCPPLPGFNVEMFVFRKCGKSGSWDNFNESFVVIEKTNYESCVQNGATHPQEYSSQYLDELIDAMRDTSIIGMVFIILSLLSILLSLLLYRYVLPKYINDILRVKIHKHLFAAVTLELLLKLLFQISILLSIDSGIIGIVQKPVVCEFLTTFNQYLEIVVLLWIVIDCHFVHVSTSSGFLCISGYLAYVIMGWTLPIVPTLLWAMTLILGHKVTCWQGHVQLSSIWIIEVTKIICLVAVIVLICTSSYRHYQTVSNRLLQDSKIIKDLTTTGLLFAFMLVSVLIAIVPSHVIINKLQTKIAIQHLATILTSSKGLFVTILCNYSNVKKYVRRDTSNIDIEI